MAAKGWVTRRRNLAVGARPFLKAVRGGGRAGAIAAVQALVRESRAVMLLTGSRDLRALARAKRVIRGELRLWIDELSCGGRSYL